MIHSQAYELGGLGLQPSDSGKSYFFGQKPTAKNEKEIFFVYLLNEKTEFILPREIKCPKSGIFY